MSGRIGKGLARPTLFFEMETKMQMLRSALAAVTLRGVHGLALSPDGKQLRYGTFDGQARLARAPLGAKPTSTALPPFGRDAVAYIAQDWAARREYAIATFEKSVYLSKDSRRSWTAIAERGNGK